MGTIFGEGRATCKMKKKKLGGEGGYFSVGGMTNEYFF